MTWVLALGLLYMGLLLLALRLSLFPVRTPVFISPGSMGAPQSEAEMVSLDGTTIRGWWVRHQDPKGVAVLVHGYLMNRSELAPLAVYLFTKGWSSLVLDLRAHGRSGGRKSTLGVKERMDVMAAARRVRAENPGLPVILCGSSMGSAACAFALEEDDSLADGLILDSAYSRLPDAVLGWWYFLGGWPLRALLWPTPLIAWPFVGYNPYKCDVARALAILDLPVLLSQIKAGKLKPIAVGAPQRVPSAPDVPTTAEAGMPNLLTENWYGMVAPAKTPANVVAALNRAAVEAMKDPAVVEKLSSQGAILGGDSPQHFAAFIDSETKKWAKVIKDAGVQTTK